MAGRIESLGKNNAITILFNEKPVEKSYYIVRGEEVCGSIEVLSVVYDRGGRYKYRAITRYTLTNAMYAPSHPGRGRHSAPGRDRAGEQGICRRDHGPGAATIVRA